MTATHHQGSDKERAVSVQTYARIAGGVFLIAFVAGGFGEFYAPSQLIVPGNAATTAHNILGSDLFFRLGFVAYLVEAITDVALTFLLYVLLRPVHANLALLAVFFRLMATATFAFAELFYFAPSLILGGDGYLKTFSPDQLHALALLSLSVYSAAGYLYIVFYGIASIILGYLMFRSGYLPKVLGALWVIGGLGFVIGNLVWIFAPADASLLLLPQVIASLSLGLWLLVRGVDGGKWKEKENEVSASSVRVLG
jgi:hypothetical protein